MFSIYLFVKSLGAITIFLAASIYLLLSLWVGCLAYNKTKLISSIPGWAAWCLLVTPVLGLVSMMMCPDANAHMEKKELESKQKLDPVV